MFVSCPGPLGSAGQIADLVLQKAAIERVRQNEMEGLHLTFLFSHFFDLFDLFDVIVSLFSID